VISEAQVHRVVLGVAICVLAAVGCGRREIAPAESPPPPSRAATESGPLVEMAPGEVFHFVGHFKGGEAPAGVAREAGGRCRLTLGEGEQPVLCVPAPYVIRQKVRLRKGVVLRTAFGLAPESWNKKGAGVRFCVRVRRSDGSVELLSEELKRWRGPDTPNWSAVTIELPGAAEEEVEIELATERVGELRAGAAEDLVWAYGVWVNPRLISPSQDRRPNIVLVLVDALRADHLGCYGYERTTSPFLDRLASEGVLFEDASSQATWTLPSTLSLLTSSYPFSRGGRVGRVLSRGEEGSAEGPLVVVPAVMPVSLQEELQRRGYTTLACVGGGFLSPALGFDAGFDWYRYPEEYRPTLADQLSVLKRQLAAAPQTPFFLFLHTHEVHNYFQGWSHCLERFDRGYLGPLTDPRRLAEAVLHREPDELSSEDLQYVRDLYDGEVLHTDRYLGLFFEWLLAQPWGRDTVIVLTADHAEALGDHGAMSHGRVPYQAVARVPLILRFPDGRWRGRRVAEPVALVDVMPTLLEAAGAAAPRGLVGRSLLPVLRSRGEGGGSSIFCESWGEAMLAREGDWSYVAWRGKGEEELYNLASDPGQAKNLAAAAPEQLRRMRRVLARLAMRAARGYRLVAAGRRPEALTVELECDGPIAYLDVPTLQKGDGLSVSTLAGERAEGVQEPAAARGQRAVITLSAGDDPQVILFESDDPNAIIAVSARMGGKPGEVTRVHLGGEGGSPDRLPVSIGPGSRVLLRADEPPVPQAVQTWGLWIWLPATAVQSRPSVGAGDLPEALLEQLRALGYLR